MAKHYSRVSFGFVLCLSLILFTSISLAVELQAQIQSDFALLQFNYPELTKQLGLNLKNTGTESWDSYSATPIYLSYRLLDSSGEMIKKNNIRSYLPKVVAPGESAEAFLTVETPSAPGDYILDISMLKEGVAWFHDRGSETLRIPMSVKSFDSDWLPVTPNLEPHGDIFEWSFQAAPDIDRIQAAVKKTMAHNIMTADILDASATGFKPGSAYPHVWVRDSASIAPTARYLSEKEILTSWIRAFLRAQNDDGSIMDCYESNGEFRVNTVESDQEACLIHAAWLASQTLGTDWLSETIVEKPILERLDWALKYVIENKTDPQTGLITGAHVADWGDVSPEFPDARALQIQPQTDLVIGIYTQACIYRAMNELAELAEKSGDTSIATFWKTKVEEFGPKVIALLWDEEKGFFRIHSHISFPPHSYFDETNIFALGGNTAAIESGLATREQALRIMQVAKDRARLFNVSTVGSSLLPCYPVDFFSHPMLNNYYEYQNGGQWDWYGAKLVLEMFNHGFPPARNALNAIVAKAFQNDGFFYEWNTQEGWGRGSKNYTTSAACLAQAIIEGFFGVECTAETITITPHLQNEEGYIYVPQPAADSFLTYHYQPLADGSSISMKINTNSSASLTVRIPDAFPGKKAKEVKINDVTVISTQFNEGSIQGVAVSPEKARCEIRVIYED